MQKLTKDSWLDERVYALEEKFFIKNRNLIPNFNLYRLESTTSPELFKFRQGLGLRDAKVLYTGKTFSNFKDHKTHWTYLCMIPKGIAMRVIDNAMPAGLNHLDWDRDTQTIWEWEDNSADLAQTV